MQILPQPLATDPAPYDDLNLDSDDPLVTAEAEAAAAARAGVDNSERPIARTPTITPSPSGPKGRNRKNMDEQDVMQQVQEKIDSMTEILRQLVNPSSQGH